jgi:hypothetical protein
VTRVAFWGNGERSERERDAVGDASEEGMDTNCLSRFLVSGCIRGHRQMFSP